MKFRSLSRDENNYDYNERLKNAFNETEQFHLAKCSAASTNELTRKSLDVLIEPV